jgi:hypothetical protein
MRSDFNPQVFADYTAYLKLKGSAKSARFNSSLSEASRSLPQSKREEIMYYIYRIEDELRYRRK